MSIKSYDKAGMLTMKSVKNQKSLPDQWSEPVFISVQANEGGESSGNVAFKNSSFLERTMGPSSICATHTILKKGAL